MKKLIALLIFSGFILNIHCQKPEETEDWSRKPEVVTPGKGTLPPSDAIVLYGGAGDLDKWESERKGPARWSAGEELTVVARAGGIKQSKVLVICSFILNGAPLLKLKGMARAGETAVFS